MVETITLPENAVESTASYFWMSDEGIVMILNKSKAMHSLEDALENVGVTLQVSAGIPRPLLIDVTNIRSMSREAREEYAKAGANGKVKAIALVTKSALGRIVANFFLGFNKPEVPTKLFNSHASAKKWLVGFI